MCEENYFSPDRGRGQSLQPTSGKPSGRLESNKNEYFSRHDYLYWHFSCLGPADVLHLLVARPSRHLEGAEIQLASLLERHPQAPARPPGQRSPPETVGESARLVTHFIVCISGQLCRTVVPITIIGFLLHEFKIPQLLSFLSRPDWLTRAEIDIHSIFVLIKAGYLYDISLPQSDTSILFAWRQISDLAAE